MQVRRTGSLSYGKWIWLALLVIWMAVIFNFSAKPAEASAQMSHSAGRMAGRILIPGYEEWSDAKQERFAERIDYPVRKGAHLTEFAVLGFLLLLCISSWAGNDQNSYTGMRPAGWSLLAGAAYAASDEIHQLFVPGRSCQFTDVLIDSTGVLLGILAGILVCRLCGVLYKLSKKTSENP